jgi:transposase
MTRKIIADDLWQLVQPYLPPPRQKPAMGRPALADRSVLTGIVFVLKTGISWDDLPEEMGCGCGATCFRRLRDWQRSGIWQTIRPILQNRLPCGARIDWSRAELAASRMRHMRSDSEP